MSDTPTTVVVTPAVPKPASAIAQFLSDPNGWLSSKRLIGFVAAANLFAFIWVFVLLGKLDAATGMWAMSAIVGAGIFGSTADHWGPK